jgi:hypothetical protein
MSDNLEEIDLLDQERKRLEEEGRKAAQRVNQVTESLEEKYLKLKLEYSLEISNLGREINDAMALTLNEFKKKWKILELELQEILECICIPTNLSFHSLNELKELKLKSDQLDYERVRVLEKLELELQDLDKKRAAGVEAHVLEYNKKVGKLKFLPKDVSTRIVQVI